MGYPPIGEIMAQQRITKDQVTNAVELLDRAVAQLAVNRQGHQSLQAASVIITQYVKETEAFRTNIEAQENCKVCIDPSEKVGLTD